MLPQKVQDIMNSNPAQAAMAALGTRPIDSQPVSDETNTSAGQDAMVNPNAPVPGGATMGAQLLGKNNAFATAVLPNGAASLMKTKSPTVQKIMSSADDAAKVAGPSAAAPGGWARTLVAGAQSALSSVADSLGDAAHATDNLRPGQGGLKGIFNTLAARSQRQAAQREELSKEKTQEALRAETFARTIQTQQNTARSAEEMRNAAYDRTQKNIEAGKDQYETKENMTPDMLSDMQKADPDFWKHWHGGVVREDPVIGPDGKPVIDPKTGKPEVTPIYSIQRYLPKSGVDEKVKVSSEDSADFKKVLGKDIPADSELSNTELQNLRKSVAGALLVNHQLESARGQAISDEQDKQIQQDKLDPTIQKYASDPKGAIAGLTQGKKNVEDHIALINQQYDQLASKINSLAAQDPATAQASMKLLEQKRQEDLQPYKDIDAKVNRVLNTIPEKAKEDYQKQLFEDRKQTEVERHNKAEEKIKDLAQKGGFLGNPNAASPEEYLNSLDPQAKAIVTLIGTGKAPINRPDYILARKPEVLEAVAKAYPDFDISKVKSYQDTYVDFTKGKSSIALNAGGTALGHLAELQALNTLASHIPHTPAWTAYQNKATTLATELAKFYGDATVPAIEQIKDSLTSTLPGNREAAIQTQAQSMGDKLDAFQQQWDNAAPSKAYQAPMPGISLQAKQARAKLDKAYAAEHPELGVKTSTTAAPVAPKGAIQTAVSADGKTQIWQVGNQWVTADGKPYKP